MANEEFSPDAGPNDQPGEPVAEVHVAEFAPLGAGEPVNGSGIDLLLDVVLKVNVELGNSSLSIKDILALGPGSVVELDKLASEPVDVFVNGTQIARGEVVVVDEKFGVRVTEVVTPQKRITSLA
ncbi:MAG: flagellar motor switch protein FliN [Chloroflexi bacterium]|nr:flagellar motor switch protein FliN [Chloroflexota bacterium]